VTTSERQISPRAVVSWISYDLANTIFQMGVVSLFFPAFVRRAVGETAADSTLSLIQSISYGIIFLLSPVLGAMSDRARRRMPFLIWSTVGCCLATALLARGPFLLAAVLFIIANAMYQAGQQFYDSLLPEVSTEANRGRISGIGVGVGYVGSYLAIAIGALAGEQNYGRLFTMIGVTFFVIALPCFFFVRERGNPSPRPALGWSAITHAAARTAATLRSTRDYPGLLRFLIGRIFYTDAVNTVIGFMGLYTTNVAVSLGLTAKAADSQKIFVMLAAITCAIPGGILWGRVVDRIGPKRTLMLVLYLWMASLAMASAVGYFHLPMALFYVVACLVGIALGGTWASDRPLMLRLAPPDRIGEFYGLYGMVGRFSAITGPALWGVILYWLVQRSGWAVEQGEAVAILVLLGMIVVGWWILRPIDQEIHRKDRRKEGSVS